MKNLIHTNFEIPEEVVLHFIKSSYQLSKRCPIGPKGDSDECIKESLHIISRISNIILILTTDRDWIKLRISKKYTED